MRTLKVEFTEEELNKILNNICSLAENDERCHKKNGHEFLVDFNDELKISVAVLIDDDFYAQKPVRHVSSDVQLITTEGFHDVESNLDGKFEDRINKALINEFHKIY